MLVSAVADPAAFGRGGITDELSKREAIAFLQGIIENGVLLDGPKRELLRKAMEEAYTLSTNLGQRVQGLLLEVRNQSKKFVVSCNADDWRSDDLRPDAKMCALVATRLRADAVITVDANTCAVRASLGVNAEIVLIRDVTESEFEKKRRGLQSVNQPLDRFTETEVDELFGRALKYTSTLRVFDYLMAKDPGHWRKYLAGIAFVVRIWEKWCVVGTTSSGRSLELYTSGGRHADDANAARIRLQDNIIASLSKGTAAKVIGYVKRDGSPRVFHARGFQAKNRCFTIDPGFDALSNRDPGWTVLLARSLAAEDVFFLCRDLENWPSASEL